jgi:hypothetical protein
MTTRMDELLREMITPPPPRRDPARRRRLVTTVAILGMAGLGMTSLVTSAVFTDHDDTGRTGILTGTVDIEAGAEAAFTLPAGRLAPGDQVFSPVTVENAGSLALEYGLDYAATSTDAKELAGQLSIAVFDVPAASCTAEGTASPQPLGSAGPGLAGTPTEIVPMTRDLFADGSEELCIRVALADSVGDAFQDAGADLQLTFKAEQDPSDPHRTS